MITGIVQNGVVVFSPGIQLPEGTPVRVEPVVPEGEATPKAQDGTQSWLLGFVGVADDLPVDMARNHDHYLHGAPKQ